MSQPIWITEAYKHLGLSEIAGARHHAEIVQFWKDIKRGGIKDDETPWCAAYVGAVMERVGIKSTRFESAKSYLDWGTKLPEPVFGCVAVFSRKGGGHVGFVVGQTAKGDLLILGGNQDNQVKVSAFSKMNVVGYRYPTGFTPEPGDLPIGTASASKSQA